MHAFREAVEAGEIDAAADLLADDAVFNSPVLFKPFEGKAAVTAVLHAAYDTFEDFRYTDELADDAGNHALIFEAKVGDRSVQGLDLLRTNEDGEIKQFTVMVRPMSGLTALAEAMAEKIGHLAK